MNLHARPYRDATDVARMRQLLVAGRQVTTFTSYMHPGYLDWDTHCPNDEQENRRDLRLWKRIDADEGQPRLEASACAWRATAS